MANLFWPAALSALPQNSYALKLLKIHYLQKLQRVNSASDRKPEKTRCTKCYNPWMAGDYSLKVSPIVARNHRKKVRRLAKLEAVTAKGDKKQEWIKRKLTESTNRHVVLTCNICQKKTKLIMKKPKRAPIQRPVEKPSLEISKSNKKRKKDAFAGLNSEVLARHKTSKPKPGPLNKPPSTSKPTKAPKKEPTPASSKNSMLDLAKFLKAKK